MVVLRIPPPRIIAESEDAYQARMLQEAVDRGEVSPGPKKVVVGDCWEKAWAGASVGWIVMNAPGSLTI
jgi:hypothetical protein